MVVGGRKLIDTLWNVNSTAAGFVSRDILKLIDTLWNVNKFTSLILTERQSN